MQRSCIDVIVTVMIMRMSMSVMAMTMMMVVAMVGLSSHKTSGAWPDIV